MAKERPERAARELGLGEVDSQQVTELPDREAMSLVNAKLALPINAALSANVLSDGALAYATAQQYAPVNQGI